MPSSLRPIGLDQPTNYLTDKDKESINRFLAEYCATKHLLYSPLDQAFSAGPLYHYTTGENLVRIIASQELWCTQISCLNDTTEFTYAIQEFQKRVRTKLTEQHHPTHYLFLRGLDQYLSAPNVETSQFFVTCFSERGDDLSQWRAYSGGEGGYAIQFDRINLFLSAFPQEPGGDQAQVLMRVEYNTKAHDTFFKDVLSKGEEFLTILEGSRRANPEDWASEFLRYWLANLQYIAPCLKHPTFESEHEWRFVYPLRPNDFERMQFRQRQSMMTRHVPLRLRSPLPITGLTVCPCRHPELSKVAVSDLLKKFGADSDIKVTITEVPYRAI